MFMTRQFESEFKYGDIRLWIVQEGEEHVVYFYHNNFPLTIDRVAKSTLDEAKGYCSEYINSQSSESLIVGT